MDLKAKIFIAGHRGLVGAALVRLLESRGYSNIQTAWQAGVIAKNAVFFRTEITCLCLP